MLDACYHVVKLCSTVALAYWRHVTVFQFMTQTSSTIGACKRRTPRICLARRLQVYQYKTGARFNVRNVGFVDNYWIRVEVTAYYGERNMRIRYVRLYMIRVAGFTVRQRTRRQYQSGLPLRTHTYQRTFSCWVLL